MNNDYFDSLCLSRCLQLAALGTSRTYPNPKVGAVLAHNGRILGEGFHAFSGGPHAEVNAIAAAQKLLGAGTQIPTDSTLYVSLEPCCHEKKRTPPCTSLILAHGIQRVVVGCLDPNPAVAGKGVALLRTHGVVVEMAADSAPFEEINRVFFLNQRLHRPYVVLKWAETADGYIAGIKDGQPYPIAITGSAAAAYTHSLRALHHGILVGRRTQEIDSPQLTVRKFYGENPEKLIFSRETFGLQALLASPIASILVEGGAETLNFFLEQDLWDEIHVLRNPSYCLGSGLLAPALPKGVPYSCQQIGSDELRIVCKKHQWE